MVKTLIDSKIINLKADKGIYRDFEVYTKEVMVKNNKRSVKAFVRRVR